MRTEHTTMSMFDAKAMRRRLEGPLASKLKGTNELRQRETIHVIIAWALVYLVLGLLSLLWTGLIVHATGGVVFWVVNCSAPTAVLFAVPFARQWVRQRVRQRLAQDVNRNANRRITDPEMDAWLASLPAITPVGKDRLATILAMNDADLDVISGWIDREVERLEIANEERHIGLYSETADLRVANVRTIREKNDVARIRASS